MSNKSLEQVQQELAEIEARLSITTKAHNNLVELLPRKQTLLKWHWTGELIHATNVHGLMVPTKMHLESYIDHIITQGYHITCTSPIEFDEVGHVVKVIIIAITPIDPTNLERL